MVGVSVELREEETVRDGCLVGLSLALRGEHVSDGDALGDCVLVGVLLLCERLCSGDGVEVAVREKLDDHTGVKDVPVWVPERSESVNVLERLTVMVTEGGLGERLCRLAECVPVWLVEKLVPERVGVGVLVCDAVPVLVLLGPGVEVQEGVGETVRVPVVLW